MIRFATATRQAFPDFDQDFDQIESEAAAWVQRLVDAEASVKRGLSRAEERQENNVEFLLGITAAGLSVRIQQLAAGTVSLVNKGNPHAAPPVARALFEACCVPIYLQRELTPRLRKGRTNAVHRLVFKLGLGGIGTVGGGHIKPIAVDALIKSARAELKTMAASLPEDERFNAAELIDMYYAALTEFTHPNWGALTLSTQLGLPPTFSSSKPFDDPLMHAVASSSAYIMGAGGRAYDALLVALTEAPMDLPNGDPDWDEGETSPATG